MRWARDISGAVAIALLALWFFTSIVRGLNYKRGEYEITVVRPGVKCMMWNRSLAAKYPDGLGWKSASERWWKLPDAIVDSPGGMVFIPHWLINLIAWSIFVVLWHRTRRHSEGCCPKCGYDLQGNASGTCSECGEALEVQTP